MGFKIESKLKLKLQKKTIVWTIYLFKNFTVELKCKFNKNINQW